MNIHGECVFALQTWLDLLHKSLGHKKKTFSDQKTLKISASLQNSKNRISAPNKLNAAKQQI